MVDHNISPDTVRKIVDHEDEKVTLHNYLYDRSDDQEILNQLEKIGEKNGCHLIKKVTPEKAKLTPKWEK